MGAVSEGEKRAYATLVRCDRRREQRRRLDRGHSAGRCRCGAGECRHGGRCGRARGRVRRRRRGARRRCFRRGARIPPRSRSRSPCARSDPASRGRRRPPDRCRRQTRCVSGRRGTSARPQQSSRRAVTPTQPRRRLRAGGCPGGSSTSSIHRRRCGWRRWRTHCALPGSIPGSTRSPRSRTRELLRLSGFDSPARLEEVARSLYDEEERARILRAAAAAWWAELRLLGVLSRTGPGEGPAAVRLQADAVGELLPKNPARPSDLVESLDALLPVHERLRLALADRMTDTVAGSGVNHPEILALAEASGLPTQHEIVVVKALQERRRELAQGVLRNIRDLNTKKVKVAVPEGLAKHGPDRPAPIRRPGRGRSHRSRSTRRATAASAGSARRANAGRWRRLSTRSRLSRRQTGWQRSTRS